MEKAKNESKNYPENRPNILLITTDQQRADTIGVLGSRTARTPNLDKLRDDGVIFSRAFVQSIVCIPSRACMQTGRYTHQHGVRHMESIIDNSPGLPPWEMTFMELLQAAGYETGATGKIHMMPERGFDFMEIVGGKGQRWIHKEGQEIGPAPLGRQYADWLDSKIPGGYDLIYNQRRNEEYRLYGGAIENILPLEGYVETYILEKSVDFIRAQRGKPFFLWCGFCGPHGPVDPPLPYSDLYPPGDIPLPATLNADLSGKPEFIRRRSRHFSKEDIDRLKRWLSFYYGLVTLIDDYAGRLIGILRETGLLDNTVVIFTSDHGEMGGDFSMKGKGNFYEPVLRVPLIIRPPGKGGGRVVDGVTEVMDIAPTILDYAGVRLPEEMSGKSLVPVIQGNESRMEQALSEFTTNDQKISGTCLRTGRYKYVLWDTSDGGEFYDLQEDPFELENLYYDSARKELRNEHAELLLKKLMRTQAGYTGGRDGHY